MKIKLNKIVLSILVVAFALSNIAIFYAIYNQSLAPSSSSAASDGKLLVKLISPSSLTKAKKNGTISIGVYAQNTTDATTSEIVLNYNKSVLQATAITEDSTILLALNKKLGTTTGKATVDIAFTEDGSIPVNKTLVTINFKVLKTTTNNTNINIDSTSSLGTPNKLTASGLGTLPLVFTTTVAKPPVKTPTEEPDPEPTTPSTDPDEETPTETPDDTATDPETETPEEEIPTTPTTTDTPPIVSEEPVVLTVPESSSRNLLIGVLVVTVSGTIVSLIFLLKELFARRTTVSQSSNPFM